ncbi:MAG: serine hydrolase, partial [Stackebrandtia sp.]
MTARRVMEAIRPYVDREELPGAVVGVWREGETSLDAAGVKAIDGGDPLSADTVVRISSNTKPMAAALTLTLAEQGVLARRPRGAVRPRT